MYTINPNFAGHLFTIIAICVSISLGISVFLIPMITQNLDKMNFSGYPDEAKLKEHVRGYLLNNKIFIWHISLSLILSFVVAFSFMGVENKINEVLFFLMLFLFGLVFLLICSTIYIVCATFNKVDKVLIKMHKMDIVLEYIEQMINQIEKIKKDDKLRCEKNNIFFAICQQFVSEKNNSYNFDNYVSFCDKLKISVIQIATNNNNDFIVASDIKKFIEILKCIDANDLCEKDKIADFIADLVCEILQKMDTKNHFYLYSSLCDLYKDNLDVFCRIVLKIYIKVIIDDKLNLELKGSSLNLWEAVSFLGFDNYLVVELFFLCDSNLSNYSLHKFYRLFNINANFYKLKNEVINRYGFSAINKKRLFASLMILFKYDDLTNKMIKNYNEKNISHEDRMEICDILIWIRDYCNKELCNYDYILWMAKIIANNLSNDSNSYIVDFIKNLLNDQDNVVSDEINKL